MSKKQLQTLQNMQFEDLDQLQQDEYINDQNDFKLQFGKKSQMLNQITNKSQLNFTPYNHPYTTSINQLISQPVGENMYSMQYVYQGLYQLSEYLWNKKIMALYKRQYQNSSNQFNPQQISFDQYLLPLQQELIKYDKFKKTKSKEQQIFKIIKQQSKTSHSTSFAQKQSYISHSSNANLIHMPSLQNQLVKCYQQVPFIYFQQNFSLDFSNFQDKQNRIKYNNSQKMIQQQETMNDNLDLIQVNLFGQIHRKFQDYFKAAANFDYLKQSITIQLHKLKQARSRIGKVQRDFVIKSEKLRKKIVQRNNYQKIIKKMKLLKSLKKLPSIIQTILQSSLPYQCLELLKSTKKSISQLENIKCVESILSNIKTCQTIVQLGLNKRYTDQLYLYIEEVFSFFNFQQQFKKVSADCHVIEKQSNNSTIHNLSRRSQTNNQTSFRAGDRSGFFVLEELGQGKGTSCFNGKPLLKNILAKRQQGKQFQIGMILLQSYEYVDFPVDVTKIKISNGLRIICRKFQKELINHIKRQLLKVKQTKQKERSFLQDFQVQQQKRAKIDIQKGLSHNTGSSKVQQEAEDSPQQIKEYIEQVSIDFYIKNIKILNELFKQCINRFLGYILTLITEYQQKLSNVLMQIDKNTTSKKGSIKSIQSGSESNILSQHDSNLDELSLSKAKSLEKSQKMSKMETNHNKFKQILSDQLSLLPSLFKIIQEKIKHFLTLKNIGGASPQQFFQWVSLLRFWQRWFDVFVQESVLINYSYSYLNSQTQISSSTQLLSLGQDMMQQLIGLVRQNIKKSISTINLKNLINELSINYLTLYSSTINAQLYQTLAQESWQSVQIPPQFSQILNGIVSKPSDNQNMSITILNSSAKQPGDSSSLGMNVSNKQLQQSLNSSTLGSGQTFKYKILKNNILIDGQRYKLTISFLLLCEFIEQFIRVGRLFEGITGENEQQFRESKYIKRILSHLYDKIYEFIDYYNSSTKEMILQKKALKMQKIKGNNITVKHICLLSNCLTFLQKITKEIPLKDLASVINKKQRQSETLYGLSNHNLLLIDKISSILNKRMEQIVLGLKTKQQQKNISLGVLNQFIVQSNQGIVTVFLQITQIIDQYLDLQKCEKILKAPFQVFVQKYFRVIIQKGEKCQQQGKILLQKMKFLKKYFKSEFVAMQRQLQ